MAGVSVSIKGDHLKLAKLVGRLQKLGGRPFLRTLNEHLALAGHEMAMQGFRTAKDPYGTPWPRLARGRKGKPLQDTRLLMTTLDARSNGTSGFSIGSGLIYARIHNEGGVIRPKRGGGWLVFRVGGKRGGKTQRAGGKLGKNERWVKVKQVVIPQRRFLPAPNRLGRAWQARFVSTARDVRRQFLGR